MADFTNAKSGPNLYPITATEAEYQRMEPILGPEQLARRFLMGIDLSSQMKDPFTGKALRWTPEMVKDIIDGAMQTAEIETGAWLRPVVFTEKHPFDRFAYKSYGFFQLRNTPASKIITVAVVPPNGEAVYSMPLEWVETAYLSRGQVNIIPMTAAQVGGSATTGIFPGQSANGGAFYLTVVQQAGWVPAYWQIEYVAGYCDGQMPRVVNDLIGTIAAMDILSMLATTYAKVQSHSLGIDGLSQSVSTPGPQIFKQRLDELKERRTLLTKKIKALTGRKIFSSVI
jgi:hypothetical protein